jgi:hypothetical protein
MPGLGLGFLPAFSRARPNGAGSVTSLLAVVNGDGVIFEVPLAIAPGAGRNFIVTPFAIDSDGNSFNVS